MDSLDIEVSMAMKPSDLSDADMVQQGAEAKIYQGQFYDKQCIIKERFHKTYRHPVLEERLTHRRITQEVKSLLRCRKAGIAVPAVYFIDTSNNCLYLEKVEHSLTVKEFIQQFQPPYTEEDNQVLCSIAEKIGAVLAMLHKVDVIHGDLTTSNMLLKSPYDKWEIHLIDFGLSQVSHLTEDKGVDLYVLEKAFLSTHPHTEHIFEQVLAAYGKNYQKSVEVLKKLEEVRQRGRKRVMVG